MSTILIAGGAGFIGSNLARILAQENHVIVIDSLITGSTENLPKHIEFINGDITNEQTLKLSLHFDCIFHLASPASPVQYARYPEETLRANSLGTWNLLRMLKDGQADQMIYTSTSEVYGDPLEHPQRETYWGNVNPFGPRSCYDESKRFGEALCYTYRSYNCNVKIARLFNTYGPNMEKNDGRVISNFVMQALEGKPITIHGNGMQTRSFCYVDDTVEALIALWKKEIPTPIVNIGNPEEYTINEVAQKVKQCINSDSEIIHVDATTDDPQRRKPDISLARSYLSWSPHVHFNEGIQRTIPYFRERFINE